MDEQPDREAADEEQHEVLVEQPDPGHGADDEPQRAGPLPAGSA